MVHMNIQSVLMLEFFITYQAMKCQPLYVFLNMLPDLAICICVFTFQATPNFINFLTEFLNFLDFFPWIQVTFVETIPKRYNTWGLESYFILWAGGGCGSGGWVWLGAGCRAQDPKCYTFLESSHQMQSKSKGKSQKNYNLKDFFFEIYYVKCEK